MITPLEWNCSKVCELSKFSLILSILGWLRWRCTISLMNVIFLFICARNKIKRFLSRRFFHYVVVIYVVVIKCFYYVAFFNNTLPLSVRYIISFCVCEILLVRKGWTKFQNNLFATRPFLLTYWKYYLMLFPCSETHLFLWVSNKSSFFQMDLSIICFSNDLPYVFLS